ncbi:hypothetical protein ACJX0J_036334, partial [Zea mays]
TITASLKITMHIFSLTNNSGSTENLGTNQEWSVLHWHWRLYWIIGADYLLLICQKYLVHELGGGGGGGGGGGLAGSILLLSLWTRHVLEEFFAHGSHQHLSKSHSQILHTEMMGGIDFLAIKSHVLEWCLQESMYSSIASPTIDLNLHSYVLSVILACMSITQDLAVPPPEYYNPISEAHFSIWDPNMPLVGSHKTCSNRFLLDFEPIDLYWMLILDV